MPDLDGPGHLLVHPGRGEHDMGSYFPDIFLGDFRFFRKIDGITHLKSAGDGHHLFPDPGKRQKGNKIIFRGTGVDFHQVLTHGQQVIMGKEDPFGQGRGPGGIEEQGHVRGLSLGDQLFKEPGVFLVQFPSFLHHFFQTDQQRVVIIPHPFGIIPDDFF